MTGTIRDLLAEGVLALAGEERVREAELLLQHALKKARAWLYAHSDAIADADVSARFRELLARRVHGEPLAYIIGRREFFSLDLVVSPAVLIPRPETELLVELALQRIPHDASVDVADLGTGSGAIALAVARERPRARVLAIDASAAALAVARENAQRLGLDRIEFARGDWFEPLADRSFDVIFSNPPYIADTDPHLARGDLRFEPRSALASGHDGFDAIRTIVGGAPPHLRPGGWLLFEHGFDQGAAARASLESGGFVDVFTAVDLGQRERVSGARTRA